MGHLLDLACDTQTQRKQPHLLPMWKKMEIKIFLQQMSCHKPEHLAFKLTAITLYLIFLLQEENWNQIKTITDCIQIDALWSSKVLLRQANSKGPIRRDTSEEYCIQQNKNFVKERLQSTLVHLRGLWFHIFGDNSWLWSLINLPMKWGQL